MAEENSHTHHRKAIWLFAALGVAAIIALCLFFVFSVQNVNSKRAEQETAKTNAIKGKVWMERATKAHEADNHDKEFEFLLKSASFDYAPAILKVSKNYETGNYVHKSDLKAREWAEKLPKRQYLHFLFRKGFDLTTSDKNAEDMETGLKFLEEGLDLAPEGQSKVNGLMRIGWIYADGPESLRDTAKAQTVFETIGGESLAEYWGSQGFRAQQAGDALTARKHYQKAMDLGSDRAQISLAYNYLNDTESEESLEIANSLMHKAIKSDDDNTRHEAATYFIEQGPSADKPTGFDLMNELANAGFDRSSRYLADYYTDNPNIEADYERAAKYIEDMTYMPPKTKVLLAHLKRTGTGTDQDIEAAFKLYQEAADESYDAAKLSIAHMHRLGLGTPKDSQKAKTLYETARYDERHPASYYIGLMYEKGDLGLVNMEKAFRHYELAIEAEYGPAFMRLAKHYETGRHVSKDLAKAFNLMTEAAYAAHPEAIENLARYYRDGIGTEPNQEYAEIWLSKKIPVSPLAFPE